MEYALESLGPERFQQLCQALLLREFQNVQCFPIGQADGGRDAVVIDDETKGSPSHVVFQVKCHRHPLSISDPHKWLIAELEGELPKIEKLISRGAVRYILATNVPGTGKSESGSIDKLAAMLENGLPIPGICWWRDDVSRRLDNAWDVKWAYADILTGPDLIRYFIENRLNEDQQRRTSAIKACLADQFALDLEVKFKQIELQNKLFDLFVDVPAAPHAAPDDAKPPTYRRAYEDIRLATWRLERANSEPNKGDEHFYLGRERAPLLGAARLLLDPTFTDAAPRIVLEGAPGQGKSTITQYVCQVHRMRLLGIADAHPKVFEQHRTEPLRLPLRADTRDFATWLTGRHPFSADAGAVPQGTSRSLEGFLAALVQHHSGGAAFDVSDLHAVLALTPALLVFDGLDEVADIGTRQQVVDEVQRGIGRLQALTAKLQVVVTSRPAAFANSPGLPESRFPRIHLAELGRKEINEYSQKWLDARQMKGRERQDIVRILKGKLDQPHLRDLARNPMQLAILLSLIHTRGSSLPDKRTALYDSYVELFFSREAEKSDVVREHRGLLLDIHHYLAFVLHRDSEYGQNGSIGEESLQKLLRQYLVDEGRDPLLSSQLFTGMVERVVALVSRVQGTYEFEVQPLREYFAARYLSETAPYSPAGNERKGTKPDRFDAIAKNFYWQNVTRFYAGCFSKGELLALADRLATLIGSPGFKEISYPRVLAATLLGDWVFTQSPRAVKEVADLVFDTVGLRHLSAEFNGNGTTISLAQGCGRDEFMRSCFSELRSTLYQDYSTALLSLTRVVGTEADMMPLWQAELERRLPGPELRRWLGHGVRLGFVTKMPREELLRICEADGFTFECLAHMVRARRFDVLELDSVALDRLCDGVLRGESLGLVARSKNSSSLEVLEAAHNPLRYAIATNIKDAGSLEHVWAGHWSWPPLDLSQDRLRDSAQHPILQHVPRLTERVMEEARRPITEWAERIEPWSAVVEESRQLFGTMWVHYQLAYQASWIRSASETCKDSPDLFDDSKPLCRRARYARLRGGKASWWSAQFRDAVDAPQRAFWLLTYRPGSQPEAVVPFLDSLQEAIDGLDDSTWNSLVRTLRRESAPRPPYRLASNPNSLPMRISARLLAFLGFCADSQGRKVLFAKYLKNSTRTAPEVGELLMKVGMELLLDRALPTGTSLKAIRKAYRALASSDELLIYFLPDRGQQIMSGDAAKRISLEPAGYPLHLLVQAQSVLRPLVAGSVVPVGEIAQAEGWLKA